MNIHTIPHYQYKFIDLNNIFEISHKQFIKYIFDNNIKDKITTKKIFYHTYILNICNTIIANNNTYTPILIFNSTCVNLTDTEIKLYYKFIKMFPVISINHCIKFSEFVELISCEGYNTEIINQIYSCKENISRNKFYFSKIHKFCKRYELTFLDKTFFGNIKNKILLV